jgi:hypothetical protein
MGRSLIVAVLGGAGTPPAPADLVGAALADEFAQVPVKHRPRHSGNGHEIADFPSFLGRAGKRGGQNFLRDKSFSPVNSAAEFSCSGRNTGAGNAEAFRDIASS